MQQYCKRFVLIDLKENIKGPSNQYNFHIKRNKNISNQQLIEALQANNFAQKVSISEDQNDE